MRDGPWTVWHLNFMSGETVKGSTQTATQPTDEYMELKMDQYGADYVAMEYRYYKRTTNPKFVDIEGTFELVTEDSLNEQEMVMSARAELQA